ncbi:MAG: alpha/beta hydrolase fold domain-containing protein [Lachnospiraceae bacterium]|nr:alpha/beta hydrolase fold domain-containing protein [Lachnospiraceae bacterium]
MASETMKYMKTVMKKQYNRQGISNNNKKINPYVMRITNDLSLLTLKNAPDVTFRPVKLGTMKGEVCIPKEVDESAILFYIHGGGMVAGNAKTSRHFASILASKTGYVTYTSSYRLAPKHPAPAAQEDCFAGYKELLNRYPDKPIFVLGESGGAYMTLTTTLLAMKHNLRLPNAVALYSTPCAWDYSLDWEKNASTDISLSPNAMQQLKDFYFKNDSLLSDPICNPLLSDYKNFPPAYFAWDKGEILAADSEKLKELITAAGGKVEGEGWPDAFHAFPILAGLLPEANTVVDQTLSFFKKHM